METKWGTPETQPPQTPEPRLCSAHVFLALALISETASIVGLIVEDRTSVVVFRGTYSVLAGLFVVGIIGWVVGVAERRVRRQVAGERAELLDRIDRLTAAVERLERQMPPTRVIHPTARRNEGSRYVGTSAIAEGDTIPLGPILAPEAEAALRRINMRLLDGGAERA